MFTFRLLVISIFMIIGQYESLVPFKRLFVITKVRNEFWVQEMFGSLYQLKNGVLHKAQGSDMLRGKLARVILPLS